jgi:hypothetical protein
MGIALLIEDDDELTEIDADYRSDAISRTPT